MSRLSLREEDIVRISLEFLSNRELHITQLALVSAKKINSRHYVMINNNISGTRNWRNQWNILRRCAVS
jgi:hypothetical protein